MARSIMTCCVLTIEKPESVNQPGHRHVAISVQLNPAVPGKSFFNAGARPFTREVPRRSTFFNVLLMV
jgi:hypothetical protein